ncbi:hypothetical protein [Undibacterium fentianense]|uniref:Uncharacterized protein n=1 Tax=Undibacterium fentianense TaxID=2828728 RepID=A0A941IEW0_9BURK|nr:hypothetical protein [Undibacterium fentianense]MBR7798450.1 hypothetical protein [Undibacterium fentianense]
MKFSRYFQELMLAYKAELDDLRSDFEGKDVMKRRLKEKREQFAFLLPMLQSNPEMLAPAFHDAFLFMNPLAFEALAAKERDKLPLWSSLSKAVKVEPWAEKMVTQVLAEEGGQLFLVTAACLEYLSRSVHVRDSALANTDEDDDSDDSAQDRDDSENGDLDGHYGRHGRDDGDDGDDIDLEEAGADWLAEQGFDRKD